MDSDARIFRKSLEYTMIRLQVQMTKHFCFHIDVLYIPYCCIGRAPTLVEIVNADKSDASVESLREMLLPHFSEHSTNS